MNTTTNAIGTGAAKRLAKHLKRGGCSARVSKGQIVFSGPSGEHDLDISVSSLERIVAHWQGFCRNNGVELKQTPWSLVVFDNGGKMVIGKLNGRYNRRPNWGPNAGSVVPSYHVRRLRADGRLCVSNTHCLVASEVSSYLI